MAPSNRHSSKKPISEIGQQVPSNLKFGIIVAAAMLWAQFLRSALTDVFSLLDLRITLLADFIVAVVGSGLGYLLLIGYRKLKSRLKKIKV